MRPRIPDSILSDIHIINQATSAGGKSRPGNRGAVGTYDGAVGINIAVDRSVAQYETANPRLNTITKRNSFTGGQYQFAGSLPESDITQSGYGFFIVAGIGNSCRRGGTVESNGNGGTYRFHGFQTEESILLAGFG